MASPSAVTVIGLTGAFGSGCSTAALHLQAERNCSLIRLSAYLEEHVPREWGGDQPSRQKLQAVGDRIRETEGRNALIHRAFAALDSGRSHDRIVVDGLRNVGEIDELRNIFGYHFVLLGVLSDAETRWERVCQTYQKAGLGRADFLEDDARDRGEEGEFGQQVAQCIDMADGIIVNGATTALASYRRTVLETSELLLGERRRPPTRDEIYMQMAYTSSHQSRCLKRHVGAVVVNASGEQISSGFNENPPTTLPCVLEPRYNFQCYRDIVRNEHILELASRPVSCPTCGKPVEVDPGPPWLCKHCLGDGLRTNLEAVYFPDRAMHWCTAMHAEERALLSAGAATSGGTLYTTTFPCSQCAVRIANARVREVVFVEAYPDPKSAERLDLAGVSVRQFEGVLSRAFPRTFATDRPT